MAFEIVDYFLVFWVALAGAVFLIGNVYDKQQKEKRRKIEEQERKKRRQLGIDEDLWAPSSALRSSLSAACDATQDRAASAYQPLGSAPNHYSSQAHSSSLPHSSNDSHQFNSSSHEGPSYLPSEYGAPSGHQRWLQEAPERSPLGYYDQVASDNFNHEDTRRSADYGADHGATGYQQTTPSLATIPTATGFSADCVEWVNSILYLFYARADKYGPIIGENVYRSLNEKLSNLISSSSEHSHLLIEFEGVNVNASSRPELTNVRTESESDKSVSATCKIYNQKISLNLSIKRLRGVGAGARATGYGDEAEDDDAQTMRYELVLENLEGKLKSMAMLNEKLIVIQFIEKPDTKILLRPLTIIRLARGPPRRPLISEDALVQIILQTLTQVVVDLYFGNDVDFPQYRQYAPPATTAYANYKSKLNNMIKGSASELKRQIKSDFFGALTSSPTADPKERKVFVKIIRAKNINYNQSATCLLELDAPRQQALSSTKQGSEPYWDEHFLFSVTDKSLELSLELWDSISPSAASAAASAMAAATSSGQAPDTPTSSLKRGTSPKRMKGGGSQQQGAAKWHKADLTAGAKFLGAARVSIEELRKNPIQKVSLALQPLSASNSDDLSNSVGGELQLELLFMEHSATSSNSQQQQHQAALLTAPDALPDRGAPGSLTSHRQALHKSNSLSSIAYQQGDIVSIDRKLTPSGFVITTTTITKAPTTGKQQPVVNKNLDALLTSGARSHPVPASPAGSSMNTEFELLETGGGDAGTSQAATLRNMPDGQSETGGSAELTTPSGGRISRSRSRSRSFIRAIKKRLSFSRTRSRSVGESGGAESPGGGGPSPQPHATSSNLDARTSTFDYDLEELSRASSVSGDGGGGAKTGRARSMPASRDPSEVPTIVINKGRLSETAVGNPFNFAQPKSQLVIEVIEPGLREEGNETPRDHVRYYAVPENSAAQRKWRKRGTKLHVFNQHQFIACHLAGSSTCHLCGRVFSRRPGKQGYKCRNCHLLSHKECHVKVDHSCPYAHRDGLRLEYIDADPPTSLLHEVMPATAASGASENQMAAADAQTQDQQRQRPTRKLRPLRSSGLKSAGKASSVDVNDR